MSITGDVANLRDVMRNWAIDSMYALMILKAKNQILRRVCILNEGKN